MITWSFIVVLISFWYVVFGNDYVELYSGTNFILFFLVLLCNAILTVVCKTNYGS